MVTVKFSKFADLAELLFTRTVQLPHPPAVGDLICFHGGNGDDAEKVERVSFDVCEGLYHAELTDEHGLPCHSPEATMLAGWTLDLWNEYESLGSALAVVGDSSNPAEFCNQVIFYDGRVLVVEPSEFAFLRDSREEFEHIVPVPNGAFTLDGYPK